MSILQMLNIWLVDVLAHDKGLDFFKGMMVVEKSLEAGMDLCFGTKFRLELLNQSGS